MSTRSTIALTKDDEHIYTDCTYPSYVDGKFIGNLIIVEMSKRNINILDDSDDLLIIEIKPGSELYNIFKNINQEE